MKSIALSALVLLGAPVAAMAGGPATPTIEPRVTMPAPVMQAMQPSVWDGYYAGVTLGFGRTYSKPSGQDSAMRIAGVNLGYRRDLGPVVLGGELSYTRDDINVKAGNGRIKNTTGVKLIVGKNLGQTLVYGAVGLARSNATVSGVSATGDGYSVGVGADYALTQQWTLGGELTSTRYNNFNNSGVTLKDTALAVKVGFRF